jgi:hypothetical protein
MQQHTPALAPALATPAPLALSVMFLALARNALEQLEEHVIPGPCRCNADARLCHKCLIGDASEEAAGFAWLMHLCETTLSGFADLDPDPVRELKAYLEGNFAEWPPVAQLADALLQLARPTDATNPDDADAPAIALGAA